MRQLMIEVLTGALIYTFFAVLEPLFAPPQKRHIIGIIANHVFSFQMISSRSFLKYSRERD